MSWETQGRQYHAWFGHGTADADGEPHELSAAEIASIVAAGAAASLSGGERAGFQQYLSNGGLKALSEAIPIWAAASKLGNDEFRRIVAGAGLPEAGTAALHDVGRLVAGARGVDDLRAASGQLAAAVRAGGTEWQYGLSYARDAAVYAAQNGLLPKGGDGSGGTVFLVAAGSSVGAAAGEATDAGLVGAGRAVLGSLGPWGRLAAIALGLGAAGYLAWRRAHGDAANLPSVQPGSGVPAASPMVGADKPGQEGGQSQRPDASDISQGGSGSGRVSSEATDHPSTGAASPDPDDDHAPDDKARDSQTSEKRAAIEAAQRKLPDGMDRAEFGDLAGFARGQAKSSAASTDVAPEVIDALKARGVTKESVSAFRDFYVQETQVNSSNAAAQHRAAILEKILEKW